MKYLISAALLAIVLILTSFVVYTLYLFINDNVYWLFVSLGFLLSDVVAVLALSSAVSSVKDY